MRLIDANALKAKLKICTNAATYSDYCKGYCDARQVDLDAIDAAPTIEPEVRHGRWLPCLMLKFRYECECCGEPSNYPPPYCPNCGARMDEDGVLP